MQNLMATLILVLFLSIFSFGQQKGAKVLQLSISTERTSVCYGDSTKVSIKLTNTSSAPVVIDRGYTSETPMFTYGGIRRDGSSVQRTIVQHPNKRDKESGIVTLRSKESMVSVLTFDLSGDFFARTDNFSLQIGYSEWQLRKGSNRPMLKRELFSDKLDYSIRQCSTSQNDSDQFNGLFSTGLTLVGSYRSFEASSFFERI